MSTTHLLGFGFAASVAASIAILFAHRTILLYRNGLGFRAYCLRSFLRAGAVHLLVSLVIGGAFFFGTASAVALVDRLLAIGWPKFVPTGAAGIVTMLTLAYVSGHDLNDEEEVCAEALLDLDLSKYPGVGEQVRGLLADPRGHISLGAATALAKLDDADGWARLEQLLARRRCNWYRAVDSLTTVGGYKAAGILRRVAEALPPTVDIYDNDNECGPHYVRTDSNPERDRLLAAADRICGQITTAKTAV